MKHEQHTRHQPDQAYDGAHADALSAALPDFQHAFAWHTDLCGISEKVLQEYAEEVRQAAQQYHAPHKSRHA